MKWKRSGEGFYESAGAEYVHGTDQPDLKGRFTIVRIPRYEVSDNARGESAMFDTIAECKEWVESSIEPAECDHADRGLTCGPECVSVAAGEER